MLTKDLLRVSRAGGGYRPRFVDESERDLAARLVGVYQGHVGETRETLRAAVDDVERAHEDFKLVRGFAALLEREATFETDAPVPPARARRVVFEESEAIPVVASAERATAFERAADRLNLPADAAERALYADRDSRQVLVGFDPRWDPDALVEQYNLSLAQTALFDATEVRVRSSDPRALVSAVKRLRLMYEIALTDDGREVVVTGPDSLFSRTRRYGTAFARLLRTVAKTGEWSLTATVDDRGTDRTLSLSHADVSVPDVEPVTEPDFDSGVETDFAARFSALSLDWDLRREPEPLATGTRVMIPDFAFDYRFEAFRVFFEVMGFWTPEYVEKKLSQLRDVEDVELVVAVDESLGVGEDVAALDHRVIRYRGRVRVKDVVDVLREYEADLLADAAATLPDELTPDDDVITLAELAARHGVGEEAVAGRDFPAHERVGRTLVRPDVLAALADEIEDGMSLSAAEAVLDTRGVDDASAALSALGFRVEWEGLSGGTIREKQD